MIPKIIHYCWFGGNPLPESAVKCINSWKKFFPDYEIWAWVETNLTPNPSPTGEGSLQQKYLADEVMEFDVNVIPYTREAYEARKFAFVSDYARFDILYQYGGIYFDTDVEVIKSMDEIVERGPFMGIEVDSPNPSIAPLVAPGLGLGATIRMPFYKSVLDYYEHLHFLTEEGKPNNITVVKHTTNVLTANGMKNENTLQEVCGVWIYPKEYFNPLNDNTGKLDITENTRSIHWYTKTWLDKRNPVRDWIVKRIHRYFGINSLVWLKNINIDFVKRFNI